MEAVTDRLKERTLDILDWVDYRPDPHWWQYLAASAVLGLAYLFTPMDLWPVLLLANVCITLFGMVVWFAGLFGVIAWRALRDVTDGMRRRRQAEKPYPQVLVERLN